MLEPELIFCSPATALAMGEFSWLQHEKRNNKGKNPMFWWLSQEKALLRRSGFSWHSLSVPAKPGCLSYYLQISLYKQFVGPQLTSTQAKLFQCQQQNPAAQWITICLSLGQRPWKASEHTRDCHINDKTIPIVNQNTTEQLPRQVLQMCLERCHSPGLCKKFVCLTFGGHVWMSVELLLHLKVTKQLRQRGDT